MAAWTRRFPTAPKEAYVRFVRGGDVPLGAVQRLSRRAQLTVDAGPQDPEDILDLAVAGAHGIVVWMHEGGDVAAMADAMGEGLLLGTRLADLDQACRRARDLGVPLLVEGGPAPAGMHGYLLDLDARPLVLRRFGDWPAVDAAQGPGLAAAEAPPGEGDAEG